MWMLDALSETPFKKPFTLLALTLGAGFLLLASLFSANPLLQPALYSLAALDLYVLWNKKKSWAALLLVVCVYALGYFLLPAYLLLFCLFFTAGTGRLVFPKTSPVWKVALSAILLYVSILMVSLWQRMAVLDAYLPYYLVPLVQGALFAFLFYCSAVVFVLQQNRVVLAINRAVWEKPGEPAKVAFHAKDLYEKLKVHLQGEEKAKEELEGFTEKLIDLCFQLQEVSRQNAHCDSEQLDREIANLSRKVEEQQDSVARQQYQKALANKEKQKEQHHRMLVQEERIRAQVLNYVSALENLHTAYLHQQMNTAGSGKETIDFFLHIAEVQAENQYQSSEAYQKLAHS